MEYGFGGSRVDQCAMRIIMFNIFVGVSLTFLLFRVSQLGAGKTQSLRRGERGSRDGEVSDLHVYVVVVGCHCLLSLLVVVVRCRCSSPFLVSSFVVVVRHRCTSSLFVVVAVVVVT